MLFYIYPGRHWLKWHAHTYIELTYDNRRYSWKDRTSATAQFPVGIL